MHDAAAADDADDALLIASRAFYVLAAVNAVALVVLSVMKSGEEVEPLSILLSLVVAKFISQRRSRALAVSITMWGVLGVCWPFLVSLGLIDDDDKHVVVDVADAFVTAIIGAFAIHASFRFHRALRTQIQARNVIIVVALATVYTVVGTVVGLVAGLALNGAGVDEDVGATVMLLAMLTGLFAALAGSLPGTRNRPWAIVPSQSAPVGGAPTSSGQPASFGTRRR